ncbi:MAG: UbiA family prenyltransferase [Actinobacteria bacterium]|nr:UbiA family prenyltransferase [Actinomycetota bacterium]
MGSQQANALAPSPAERAAPGRLESAVRFVRLVSAAASVVFVCLGVATATDPTVAAMLWAVAVGLPFHVFAFASNDVVDLPIDRTDPRRARSPLVAGVISPQVALVVALAHLPVAFLALLVAGGGAASGSLAGAAVGLMLYNLVGKRLGVPLVADLGQGAAFALLVVVGAALGSGPTHATWWVAAYVAIHVALVNGIHGALRDAENDAVRGARTTALLLGASASPREGIAVPAAVRRWGVVLQAVLLGLLVVPLLTGAVGSPRSASVALAAVGGLAVAVTGTWMLALAYARRHDLRAAMACGTWHVVAMLAAPLVMLTPRLVWPAAFVAAAVLLAPPLLFDRAVRTTAFQVPGSTASPQPTPGTAPVRGLWRMTRPGNWVVAAAVIAIGGLVSGGPWWRYVCAMVAAACVVMATNVCNDRCDGAADRLNRPDRPLPAGLVTGNAADRFVLATAVVGVCTAALLDAAAAVVTGAVLVLGLCYSVALRRLGVLGPLSVALSFAALAPAGGLFVSHEIVAFHGLAVGLVLPLVFGRECLKAVPDQHGDRVAGFSTVATRYGSDGAVRLFRAGCLVSMAVAVVPAFAGAGIAYVVGACVCVIVPGLVALWRTWGHPSASGVAAALELTGRVFGLGLLPLLVLAT